MVPGVSYPTFYFNEITAEDSHHVVSDKMVRLFTLFAFRR